MNKNASRAPEQENLDLHRPGEVDGPGYARVIFWLLFLYALGFALMVVEDLLNHIFI